MWVVQVSKKRTKTSQQPAKTVTTSVSKKNGRRVLKSVAKDVAGYRPDLKVCVALIICERLLLSDCHRKQHAA